MENEIGNFGGLLLGLSFIAHGFWNWPRWQLSTNQPCLRQAGLP